jgi:GntR family transcriptional regulator
MFAIDRNSRLPYYYQLKQILLAKIQSNEWKPGELIPSEHTLEEQYQVSRTTIRQTLNELVVEGYLIRQRGRGTFIAQPKVAYDPSRRLDLNEYMEQQGIKLDWRLIDYELCEAPPRVQDVLRSAKLRRLRRLRLAGQEVIGYHIAYIPDTAAVYVDESQFCVGESLGYLRQHPLMAQPRVERTLEASLAEKPDLELMNVKRNSAVLHMERLVSSGDNTPIEFLVARFRGDRFKFRVTNSSA